MRQIFLSYHAVVMTTITNVVIDIIDRDNIIGSTYRCGDGVLAQRTVAVTEPGECCIVDTHERSYRLSRG